MKSSASQLKAFEFNHKLLRCNTLPNSRRIITWHSLNNVFLSIALVWQGTVVPKKSRRLQKKLIKHFLNCHHLLLRCGKTSYSGVSNALFNELQLVMSPFSVMSEETRMIN